MTGLLDVEILERWLARELAPWVLNTQLDTLASVFDRHSELEADDDGEYLHTEWCAYLADAAEALEAAADRDERLMKRLGYDVFCAVDWAAVAGQYSDDAQARALQPCDTAERRAAWVWGAR